MTRRVRSFLVGFLCALCLLGLLLGIAVADENTRLTGLRGSEPFFTVQQEGPLRWDVQLFGERAALSFQWLNTAAAYGQRFFFFVPPTARIVIRLAGSL